MFDVFVLFICAIGASLVVSFVLSVVAYGAWSVARFVREVLVDGYGG